jgi:hypothetical protein
MTTPLLSAESLTQRDAAHDARQSLEDSLLHVLTTATATYLQEVTSHDTLGAAVASWSTTVVEAVLDHLTPLATPDYLAELKTRLVMDPGPLDVLNAATTLTAAAGDAKAVLQSAAERIARTEATRAYNANALDRMTGLGVVEKEWVSQRDKAVRRTHSDADGQRVPLGASFNVGGFLLRYPGDHLGPYGETVNCRCVIITPDDVAPLTAQVRPYELSPTSKRMVTMTEAALQDREIGGVFGLPAMRRGIDWARKRITDTTRVKVTQTFPGFTKMLADGKMRTIHEGAKTSRSIDASQYLAMRSNYERRVMGVPAGEGPVYGWVEAGNVADVDSYGPFTLVLKPHTRPRTSVSFGDSMDESLAPIWMDDVADASQERIFEASSTLIADEHFPSRYNLLGYVEAQVHGGVTLDDIAEIITTERWWSSLGSSQKEKIAQLGVKVTLFKDGAKVARFKEMNR